MQLHSEVPPLVLLELDALEERLEVARPEPLVAVALDQLDEHRRPVLHRLREDLKSQSGIFKYFPEFICEKFSRSH